MIVTLHWEDYKALLRGQYTLLPCAECSNGIVYWNGVTGDVVSLSDYKKLMEESPDDHDSSQEVCNMCMGMGKVVRFD